MLSPKEFIDNLQQELQLTGIANNEINQKILDKTLKRLNNALEKLSIELYKKDTHFFLELIQNADDNQYLGNVTPLIKFLITQKKIIVQNNETGFTEENVRSLCVSPQKIGEKNYPGSHD